MMNGADFVDILTNEFGIAIGAATKNQWRAKAQISPTVLRNAFRTFERQKIKEIVEDLKGKIGIYAFYATGGRLVYVGKTEKNNLLSEMSQRFGNKKVPFRVLKQGKSVDARAYIKYVAEFVSAYEVGINLITNVEALLTRIIINNATNIRIESFVGLGRPAH